MEEQEALQLLIKYRANQCTAQETAAVESYFIDKLKNSSSPEGEIDYDQLETEIWSAIAPPPVKRRVPFYFRFAAAAIVILVSITSAYYFISDHNHSHTPKTILKDIQPGGNSATLTLANGTQIPLDSLNGNIATGPSGALISNNSGNGVITYQLTGSKTHEAPDQTNTITTPQGGQYQLILSDGTQVYLNAGSTLRFSVRFAANERKVFLSGEGYFEVAKDAKRPFIVSSQGQTIKVLGTHFNVSAYPDETIKTTLAEGSVELTSSSLQKQLLKPDQQALLLSTGYQIKQVNSADEMAWKDGLFVFKQVPITDVLHQLSRWYGTPADY